MCLHHSIDNMERRWTMEFLNGLLSSLVSTSVVIAILAFLGRSFFTRYFDNKFEVFKNDLGIVAKKHELTLQSQIVFKERQLAEFYGPIYALLKQIRPVDDLWSDGKFRKNGL